MTASFAPTCLSPARVVVAIGQRPLGPPASPSVPAGGSRAHSSEPSPCARERRPLHPQQQHSPPPQRSQFFRGSREHSSARPQPANSTSRRFFIPSCIQVPLGGGPAREFRDLFSVALRPVSSASSSLLSALLPADVREKLVRAAKHDASADASGSWLPGVFRGHSVLATVGTLALALCYGSNLPISLSVELQTWILAAFFIAIGLPHAALDHISAYPSFQGWFSEKGWLPAFLTFYLSLTAVTGYFWMVQPFWSLLAYLGLAVLHFGSGDLEHGKTGAMGASFATEILARGLVPISATLKYWPTQVADLFHLVSGLPAATFVPFISAFSRIPSIPIVALACFGVLFTRAMRRKAAADAPEAVPASLVYNVCRVAEPATLFLLFRRLPPLLSFTTYWIFWHSVRHVLHVSSALSDAGPLDALRQFYRLAVPFTAAPLVLFACLYVGLINRVGSAVALLRMMFVGMSCVLLPHVIVSAWAHRSGPASAASSSSSSSSAPAAPAPSTSRSKLASRP